MTFKECFVDFGYIVYYSLNKIPSTNTLGRVVCDFIDVNTSNDHEMFKTSKPYNFKFSRNKPILPHSSGKNYYNMTFIRLCKQY